MKSGDAANAVRGEYWKTVEKNYGRPTPTSLPYLDRNMYRKNTDVVAHFQSWKHDYKLQMMAIGERRFLFSNSGDVIEVTNPLNPELFNTKAYAKGTVQLAYNARLRKWLLVVGARVPGTFPTPQSPHGKHSNPELHERIRNYKGLRGLRIYDATDPAKIVLLSEWSCDQGDPKRELQEGGGGPDTYYDGGRYLYVEASPDNTFTHFECGWRAYCSCLQILDIADPAHPRFVTNWWIPGQRTTELEEARKWPEFGDRESFNSQHTSVAMPQRVEDGGRLAYSAWGSFGLLIHDVSDVRNPKLIGRFNPPKDPGGIPFHTVDIARLDRGFVIINSEPLHPDCAEPYQPLYVVDVTDPANPKEISRLPVPVPPPDAPYATFFDKRGRFGTHNAPFIKAPGKPDPNLTAYSFFNAGLQIFDVSDPKNPRITGYFIPPQSGRWEDTDSHNRDVEVVYIEWDRKLIWVGAITGLYCITSPLLGKPVLGPLRVSEWALPHLNQGHDSR